MWGLRKEAAQPQQQQQVQAKKRILIIDDETGITRLMKENLEDAGPYDVMVENQAVRALDTARRFQPDLILLDVMMPDRTGGEVASEIERDPALKHVPISFITAAVRRAELGSEEGVIGGRAFLAKPIKLSALINHIERRLKTTATR